MLHPSPDPRVPASRLAVRYVRYFEPGRPHVATAEDLYAEDAILEFPQSGERFLGRDRFTEWRARYPADVRYRLRRVTGDRGLVVAEVLLSYEGSPWIPGVGIAVFRDERIEREFVYVADRWGPAAWRASGAQSFDPEASIAPEEWRPDIPFGLEAALPVPDPSGADAPIPDHATTAAALVNHWRHEGIDYDASHEIYHEDAILEFPQSGERFVGRDRFLEWRKRYPAQVAFRIRRISGANSLWVAENQISYDGGPLMPTLNVLRFRGERIAREALYVMQPWDPPAWRASWATPFDREASVAPEEWRPGVAFGLEADLAMTRTT